MTFPTIITIDDLLPRVSHKSEIRSQRHANGTTTLCYMIAGEDTFDSPHARECRGVTFGPDGRIAGRPLHKFFNVGERPETMPDAIDWSKVMRVMDKRDGSMVHPVLIGEPYVHHDLKSKKSFDSYVASGAKQFVLSRPGYRDFCGWCLDRGLTPTFEWTSRNSRIVIDYGAEAELQLLHVRDNVTGEYWGQRELDSCAAAPWRIPLVASVPLPDDPMIVAGTVEGIEGWVIQFADGDMVKLKTRWYLDRHHCMTALRRRDVARAVVDQTLDDLKSKLTMSGVDIAPVLAVESEVLAATNAIRSEVAELHSSTVGRERKDIAIAYKGHPYFSLLMQQVSGREPDVSTWFSRHMLDEMFDLDLVMRDPMGRLV